MRSTMRALTLLLAAGAGLSACAYQDYGYGAGYDHGGYHDADDRPDYGDYAYDGRDYDRDGWDRDGAYFDGPGAVVLDSWLATTAEGREIVSLGFGGDGRGWIDEDLAHRANIWFRRYADSDDDLRLTDEEIRLALVQGSLDRPWRSGGY